MADSLVLEANSNASSLVSEYPVKYMTTQPLDREGGYSGGERHTYPIGADSEYVDVKDYKTRIDTSTDFSKITYEVISLQTWINDAYKRIEVKGYDTPSLPLQDWLSDAENNIKITDLYSAEGTVSLNTWLNTANKRLEVNDTLHNNIVSLQAWLNGANDKIAVRDYKIIIDENTTSTNLNNTENYEVISLQNWINKAYDKIEVKGFFTRNTDSKTVNTLQAWIDTIEEKVGNNTLKTSVKNTTGAINELKDNIGNTTDLTTTNKTLVTAINEVDGQLQKATNKSTGVVQGDGTIWTNDGTWTKCKVDNGYVYFQPTTQTFTNILAAIYETNAISKGRLSSSTKGDLSIAFGSSVDASGKNSVSIGHLTSAQGDYSHAEGYQVTAVGSNSHAEGDRTSAIGIGSHAEGGSTKAVGNYSHAEGQSTTAIKNNSHAEGQSTYANDNNAHAEGHRTSAMGGNSHAEGQEVYASGGAAHAEGHLTSATGIGSHAEGHLTSAVGNYSHAEGESTKAVGNYSHAEGESTKAVGNYSHAEGYNCTAYGNYSHVEGYNNDIKNFTAYGAHVEGYNNIIEGDSNDADFTYGLHVSGKDNLYQHTHFDTNGQMNCAGGYLGGEGNKAYFLSNSLVHGKENTVFYTKNSAVYGYNNSMQGAFSSQASINNSFIAGYNNTVYPYYDEYNGTWKKYPTHGVFCFGNDLKGLQGIFSIGHFNDIDEGKNSNTGDDYTNNDNPNNQSLNGNNSSPAFVIGNGYNSISRSNAFRVNYNGTVHASSYNSKGADYAEYFEWADGNINKEDRVGYFVTLDKEEYIKKASQGDYILGIISANPSVIGDADEYWKDKFKMDEWGREIYLKDGVRELNPNYDSSKKYVPREKRFEWSAVGLKGKLLVRDDGTCVPGGFCQCGENGIATKAESYIPGYTFKVMKRTADNIIKVIL